jgi:hypothetical protein
MSAARELGAISLASIGHPPASNSASGMAEDPACAECGVNALNREAGLAIIRDNGSHGTFIIQHVGSLVHAGSSLDDLDPTIHLH